MTVSLDSPRKQVNRNQEVELLVEDRKQSGLLGSRRIRRIRDMQGGSEEAVQRLSSTIGVNLDDISGCVIFYILERNDTSLHVSWIKAKIHNNRAKASR